LSAHLARSLDLFSQDAAGPVEKVMPAE